MAMTKVSLVVMGVFMLLQASLAAPFNVALHPLSSSAEAASASDISRFLAQFVLLRMPDGSYMLGRRLNVPRVEHPFKRRLNTKDNNVYVSDIPTLNKRPLDWVANAENNFQLRLR